MDVAPTILHLLDVPCPDELDGVLLTDALRDEAVQRTTSDSLSHDSEEHAYTADEEELIAARLRALGLHQLTRVVFGCRGVWNTQIYSNRQG